MKKNRTYKKMADGGTDPAERIKADNIKQYYYDYMNSPNYTKRLKGMGYSDPQSVIKARTNQLKKTDIVSFPNWINGSTFSTENNRVFYDPAQARMEGFNKDLVIAHELSHAAGSLIKADAPYGKLSPLTLNQKEIDAINSRNKAFQQDPLKANDPGSAIHDSKANELKSDIDSFKFKLKKDKLYDTGTQEFDQKILNKVKDKYSKDPQLNRIFDRVNDKDLIYIMNNIASNDPTQSTTAENGITMKVNKKNLLFSNLPTMKQLRNTIKADYGTSMMGPGPRDPRVKNMVQSLPDNYFDIFNQGKDNPTLPNRAEIPISHPGQIEAPMSPVLSNPGVRPQANLPHRNPNIGNAMLLGLEAIDAAIPGDRIHNQQVIRPQMGYSQYPLGTGSQAIMADGGEVDGQQPPTRKPIRVEDFNDPRLHRYNDSLTLYNYRREEEGKINNTKKTFQQLHSEAYKEARANKQDDVVNAARRLEKYNGRPPEDDVETKYRNFPDETAPNGEILRHQMGVEQFAKPVQPYYYQPNEIRRSNTQKVGKTQRESLNILPPTESLPRAGKQTNFSFSGRDDQGQQTTRYFNDLDTWKNATDQMGYRNREITDSGRQASATGYQFDDGGWMMDPRRQTPIVIPEGVGDNMPSAARGYGIPIGHNLQYEDLNYQNMEKAKSGNWIKGAVNPAHKGYCTPMTKSTCTPRRKAFAKTMKKHHGFHENGGIIPDPMSAFSPHEYANGGTARGGSDTFNLLEQIVMHPNQADMEGYADGGPITVANARDPRYRAYQDSLTLNRMSAPLMQMSQSANPVNRNQWAAQTQAINRDPAFSAAKEDLRSMHGSYPVGNTVPVRTVQDGSPNVMYESNVLYPAPVQPVRLRKNKNGGTNRGGSDTPDMLENIFFHPNGNDMRGFRQGGSMRGESDTPNLLEQIVMHPNMSDMEGWDKAKKGKTLTRGKAREILHDGTAQGHPITEKQRKYFGAVASGYAASGLDIGPGGPGNNPVLTGGRLNSNTDPGRHDAYLVDEVNYRLTHPTARAMDQQYNPEESGLLQDAFLWGRRPDQQSKSPQDVISSFYGRPTQQDPRGALRQKLNNIGYGATAMYNSTPDITVANRANRVASPTASTFERGGIMYDDGGQINTMWGGDVNQMSENPYDGGTMQFDGASHDDGGIGMHYNGNPVEVEGGETAARDSQGNLNIYGNMYLPGTRTKFKQVAKEIGKKEKRYDSLKTRGSELVNNSNPANKFEKLAFNAGRAMMSGGSVGQKDLAEKKENLAMLQRAMLDTADEHGIDAQHMSKGVIKKAKNGGKARGGAYIPFAEDGATTNGDPNDPTRADRNHNPGNMKYGKRAKQYGATGQDKEGFAIFPNRETGLGAMRKLLKSGDYNSLPVSGAISKWTAGKPYRYELGDLANKKVSDLSNDEFDKVIGTMQKGEGTRYGAPTTRATPPPISRPPRPVVPFTPYNIPNIPLTPDQQPPTPQGVNPPPLGEIPISQRPQLPSNAEPLQLEEVLPELYGAASNRVEPVAMQKYNPEMFTPYQVSFQDRLNQNQSTYNALQRTVGSTNPTALGAIAAQKYSADSGVKGEEFRTNQAISNDITNRNIALNNDAQLKNLSLADQQYVRQSTAKSKTKEFNQMILNSLSSKYAQNKLENKKLGVYENLYDYRFMPTDQGGQQATYFGPDAAFNYGRNPAAQSNAANLRVVSRYDNNGNPKGYTTYDNSQLKDAKDAMELEMQRRKLPLLTTPPL